MKVLVIATLRDAAAIDRIAQHIWSQAATVWSAYKSNHLREMYYWANGNQPGGAVLVYETDTVDTARALAQSLPVVQAGLVDLDLYALDPYVNLEVLFAPVGEPTHA